MKKYFPLIVFFTLVFLWLGNYSFATTCQDWTTICNDPLMCDCSQPDLNDPTYPSTAWLCNACKSPPTQPPLQCAAWEILVDDWAWWQSCCDASCQAIRASMLWDPCDSPKNGVRNWWIVDFVCSCPYGKKNIDNVCEPCNKEWVCCGISLNTSIPFIGNCIENSATDRGDGELAVSWTTAFPVLMWSLTKILVTVILIVSFVLIVMGGIMISIGKAAEGRKMIINVIIGIALLWASGVILRLINPNFFG